MTSTKDLVIRKIQNLAAAEKAKWEGKPAHTIGKGDPSGADPDHPQLIAIDQAQNVRYWIQVLGCSEQELYEAVGSVGNSAEDVRQYLGLLPPPTR